MKKVHFLLIFTVVLAVFFCQALCEDQSACRIEAGEEWSWDPSSNNTFDGEIDLSEFTGQEISVVMSSDLSYDSDTPQSDMPVFTRINGKRITVLKQTNTIRCTPDDVQHSVVFSGKLRLPDKQHISRILFTFTLYSNDSEELKTISCQISSNADNGKAGSVFYIRHRIEKITLYLWIPAVCIWVIVMIRHRIRKKQTGENKHADL
jgi:hypothetical protein